jgi:signal peptide peptidase SppA
MKYHEIISALTEEPLLITPSSHASLFKLFEDHRALSAEAFKASREGVDMCGNATELPQMEVIDGIAHIPIYGPLGFKLGKFEKGAGCCDCCDIMDELDEAEEDSNVRGIILDIDSPGGMVSGTPELAARVMRCDKPVFTFTDGDMCSAVYWVGCSADQVFCTRSANIGSIGVYCPFLDSSERMKAAGLKMEIIASGKYKGMGAPGTSLTQDHRDMMMQRVCEIADMFAAHVLDNRPGCDLEDMQGQTFIGQNAVARGLVDQVVNDKQDCCDMM